MPFSCCAIARRCKAGDSSRRGLFHWTLWCDWVPLSLGLPYKTINIVTLDTSYPIHLGYYGKWKKHFLTLVTMKGSAEDLKKSLSAGMANQAWDISGSKAAAMNNERTTEVSTFLGNLKSGIWFLGISSWLFGITDRSIASFSDGYLSAIDIMQLLTASFFFVSWLFLKPTSKI